MFTETLVGMDPASKTCPFSQAGIWEKILLLNDLARSLLQDDLSRLANLALRLATSVNDIRVSLEAIKVRIHNRYTTTTLSNQPDHATRCVKFLR